MEEPSQNKIIISYLSENYEIPLPNDYKELMRTFINIFSIDAKNQELLNLKYNDGEDDVYICDGNDYIPFKQSVKENKIKNEIIGFITAEVRNSYTPLDLYSNICVSEISERHTLGNNDSDTVKEEEIEKIKENLELIKNENNNYKNEIEEYNSKIKILEEKNNEMIAEKEKHDSKIKELEDEKKKIIAENEKHNSDIKSLEEEKNKITAENEENILKIKTLEEEKNKMIADNEKHNSKIEQLEEEKNKIIAENEENISKIKILEQEKNNIITENDNNISKIKQLEEEKKKY